MTDTVSKSDKQIEKIIKEFLFHSLSESQLSDLKTYFSKELNNVRTENGFKDVSVAEIKLMGGSLCSSLNSSLNFPKTTDTFLVFPCYRGGSDIKIIQN